MEETEVVKKSEKEKEEGDVGKYIINNNDFKKYFNNKEFLSGKDLMKYYAEKRYN